jgi:hypothetical protein
VQKLAAYRYIIDRSGLLIYRKHNSMYLLVHVKIIGAWWLDLECRASSVYGAENSINQPINLDIHNLIVAACANRSAGASFNSVAYTP